MTEKRIYEVKYVERLEGALREIKDGNADGCPDCKYNEGVAREALSPTQE